MVNICMLLLAGVASLAANDTGPDLPPGLYCGITGECCRNRQDSCAHRILDTLCYCDEFCALNRTHHDCCPDYIPVCRNESLPLPPQTTTDLRRYRGKRFADNCYTCTGMANNNVVSGAGNSFMNSFGNTIMSGNNNRFVNSNNNRIDSGNGNSLMNSNNNKIKSGNGNSIENGNGNSITSGNNNRIVDTDGFSIESGNGMVVVNGNVRR